MRLTRHGLLAIACGWVFASLGSAPLGVAANEPERDTPTLQDVEVNDGGEWKPVALHTGSVEGPDGGETAKARFQSRLGGPKTFFILAGASGETAVSVARPRFRMPCDAATARRVQLAALDAKDESRRTPIEIRQGIAVFKRGVELEVTRVRDGLWEWKPKKSLQPGEYVLVLDTDGPVADLTILERGY